MCAAFSESTSCKAISPTTTTTTTANITPTLTPGETDTHHTWFGHKTVVPVPRAVLASVHLRVRGQALAIFFGITSFTLFLSITIYAGEVNKAGALSITNPNGKLPGGKWGPGFGLTIFGTLRSARERLCETLTVCCCRRLTFEREPTSHAKLVAWYWTMVLSDLVSLDPMPPPPVPVPVPPPLAPDPSHMCFM